MVSYTNKSEKTTTKTSAKVHKRGFILIKLCNATRITKAKEMTSLLLALSKLHRMLQVQARFIGPYLDTLAAHSEMIGVFLAIVSVLLVFWKKNS